MNYRQRPFPSTEFMLVVECCRWVFAKGGTEPIRQLASGARWDRVLALSRRHRVQGLAWHCLRSAEVPLPVEIAGALSEDATAVAQHNLRAVRQSAVLLKSFESAGISLAFIKGLTLASLAYGDPFLKMSWDVDVLIPEDAARAAAKVLQRLDYRLILPAVPPQSPGFCDWHRRRKESVWLSPDGLHLELHTRLADNPALIPGIDVNSACRAVEVSRGIRLPTFATDELFAYLCVHGASSAWFRLKWITDLAALLYPCAPEEIERLYVRSQRLGAGRSAAQALLLAARVYGTVLGPALEKQLNGHAVNRWLAGAAWAQMTRKTEPTEALLGTASIHLTQLLMLPGARFKLAEAARQISDWAAPVR